MKNLSLLFDLLLFPFLFLVRFVLSRGQNRHSRQGRWEREESSLSLLIPHLRLVFSTFIFYTLVSSSYLYAQTTYKKGNSKTPIPFKRVNPSDTQSIVGNYQIVGNAIECVTDKNESNPLYYKGNYARYSCSNDLHTNNNKNLVKYINIDQNSIKNSIKNSSKATLKLPSTFKDIKWVGLFWQGHINNYSYQYTTIMNKTHYSNDLPNNSTSTDNLRNDTNISKVLIRIGDNDSYHDVNASEVDYATSSCATTRCVSIKGNKRKGVKYASYADITSLFNNKNFSPNQNINITVANLSTSIGMDGKSGSGKGQGNYGAWTIAVIYGEDASNDESKLRNINIYQGYYAIKSKTIGVNISDLYLPKYGTVNSKLATFVAEGDYTSKGNTNNKETVTLNNQNLSENISNYDNNNVFDSRLSDDITRYPKLTNNNGVDIDIFDGSDIMTKERDDNPNNTSYDANIAISTANDGMFPSMITFSTELYMPRVCYYINQIKSEDGKVIYTDGKFTDKINSSNKYKVSFLISNMKKDTNDSNIEDANKVKIHLNYKDFDYTKNSTSIKNIGDNTFSDITDANDTDIGEFLTDENKSIWNLGQGASSSDGGEFKVNLHNDDALKSFADVNGTFSSESNNAIDLSKIFKFSATLQTAYLTINTPIALPQCKNFDTTGNIYTPMLGTFDVVNDNYSEQNDPKTKTLVNTLYTQVVNKDFNVTAVHLNQDKITPENNYEGLVQIKLIHTPKTIRKNETDAQKQNACDNAQILTDDNASYVGFNKETHKKFTVNYSRAVKDTTFRTTYLVDPENNNTIQWSCSNNSYQCIWGMLVSKIYTATKCKQGSSWGECKCADKCMPSMTSMNGDHVSNECLECIYDTYGKNVCSRDNFAIRPYSFRVFGKKQYKLAAEDFNITIKGVDKNNNDKSSGHDYNVSGANGYDANLSDLNIKSHFYVPSDDDVKKMNKHVYYRNNDTDKSTVANCPHKGTFTINNSSDLFTNGNVNASLKFSETGILDLNVSEKPGDEWAKVDADDTNDSQRYIKPATVIFDNNNINVTNLLLFAPYKFDTTVEYNTTNAKNWLYMHDINGSNKSFTTPKMAAYIKYTITAKNKDGNIVQNVTKTCFPDTSDSAPKANGMKLNTTIDLFLDADINSSADANISLYTEDYNTSSAIYTPLKNKFLHAGNNHIREIILPINFQNGVGKAKAYFNIDKNNSIARNPMIIGVLDANTSTSWMDNDGSPKEFNGGTINQSKTFIYGRTHAPRQRFAGKTGNTFIYYEVYCNGTDDYNVTCNKTMLPNGVDSNSSDDPRWFINSSHQTTNDGNIKGLKQIGTASTVTSATPTGANPDRVALTYDESKGYPYKTTMETNASSWLIYNKYDSNATTNESQVEFIDGNASWSGAHETNTTTVKGGTSITNRRVMW